MARERPAKKHFDPRSLDLAAMRPLSSNQRDLAIAAFKLIDPSSELREVCAGDIVGAIKTIEFGRRLEPHRLSPRTQKLSYLKSAKNLRRAADIFAKELGGITIVGRWTETQLKDAITAAKFIADKYERCAAAIHVPEGGSLRPIAKICASEAAQNLLMSYKNEEPGLTRNGLWHQLAEALYGGPVNFDILQDIRDQQKNPACLSQEQVDMRIDGRSYPDDTIKLPVAYFQGVERKG
jgi:hypothetical protein